MRKPLIEMQLQKKNDLAGSTITYWTKREEDLKAQKNKANKITIHKRTTPKYHDIENNLIEFIKFNRKLNNPVTTWCIVNELFKY